MSVVRGDFVLGTFPASAESLQCKILRYTQHTLNQSLVEQHVTSNKIFILHHSYRQFKRQPRSHGSRSAYVPPQSPAAEH